MPVRVSPTETNPTHHFALQNRDGKLLGLTACNEKGEPLALNDPSLYVKQPVETTASKQTSGSSSYDIFDYPYSPIVQDDLSGGRASLDFERDSTKFYDSFRTLSGRANKAYAGPLEQYTTGLRSQDQNLPGSVGWIQMTGDQTFVYKRFQAGASYSVAKLWGLVRRKGTPKDLIIKLRSDSSGAVGGVLKTLTITADRMEDVLSEWLNEAITSQAIVSGTYYWLVVNSDSADDDKSHWKIAVKETPGTTYYSETFVGSPSVPTAANFDLYFRTTDADTDKACIFFEYKEQQYCVISGSSGAPQIFMMGYRGAADSNVGQLNKLIDATQSWATNALAGSVVLITDGTGKLEPQPWRVITSNIGTEVVVDTNFTIQHDTTTEYVVLLPAVREITGHGLTAPVTSVLVSTTGVIYFCMGDSVTVRRMREYNNAGTWTREYADETAGTKAVFMVYKPQAQKIVIANNSDASGNVSCSTMSNASVPAWGTALTWSAAVPIDSKYRRINSLVVYPDASGTEAVWVFKTDVPFILPGSGNPYPVSIDEMKTVRSQYNGVNPLRHGVYLYFPVLQGLEQYYGGQFTDMGPNLGEGLPANRRGPIVAMQGYPGKFFIAIDAGSAGYSSVMDSGGWHERYRAPKGQRILAMTFQVTPGTTLDRLWIYQGNDLVWLPFPSSSTNELEDSNYPFAPEFSVHLSRMHAGMYDVQKIVKKIKLQSEQLETDTSNGQPICWFELDYKVDDDNDDWTTITDVFNSSPTQEVDFALLFGIAGKVLELRLRGYTRDSSKTPVFLAIIVSAVTRVDVKNVYGPFTFRIEDDEKVKGLREIDSDLSAADKLAMLEDWSDASNDSMLKLMSVSSMMDSHMIFMNVGTRRQIGFKKLNNSDFTSDVYLLSASFQEA